MGRLRLRSPPLLVALVVVTLALASMGVAYTLWADTLEINGSVATGEVDAKWSFVTCSEFYPWPDGGNSGEFAGKNVGSWTVSGVGSQVLTITVTNAYPSYSVDCEVEFKNTGTIPWKIRGWTISGVSPPLTDCTLTISPGGDNLELTCDELTVVLIDGVGTQVHPGVRVGSSLRFHVEQAASQGTTYQFQVVVCVAQWNEDPTFEACVLAAPP